MRRSRPKGRVLAWIILSRRLLQFSKHPKTLQVFLLCCNAGPQKKPQGMQGLRLQAAPGQGVPWVKLSSARQ
jgi:hypothetical protein